MMIEKINELKTKANSEEVKQLCENALDTMSSAIYNKVTPDAKHEIERVTMNNLFSKLSKYKDNKDINEWLLNQKRLFTVKNLGVREAVNSLNESKELKSVLERFKDALDNGAHEAILYEDFVTALSPFGYFPVVGNAIQSIKDRVDKYKTDVDITKILETMKTTRSNYLVPLIEDVVNNYLSNKNKQTKHQLTETLMKFTYDPFVRDIVSILTMDATDLQLEYANAECDIEKVYSPVLYLRENESVFSVNNVYYVKKGNNVTRLSESEISKLDVEFKSLCEVLSYPNVVVEKDGITVYGEKDKAIITEEGIEVNGKKMTNEDFNNAVQVSSWAGNTNFYQLTGFINENFDEIAEVDFVKRVYLKENEKHSADIFKLRDNVFITTHDPDLGKSTFYRNINPIQAKNLMMEHLRFDVSSLYKGVLPDEEKIVSQINETKEEYNDYITHLNEKIEEFKSKNYSNDINDAILEALQEELTEVKNEYKDYLNNVEKYTRANESITVDINVDGKKYTVPIPTTKDDTEREEDKRGSGSEVGTEYIEDKPASAVTFDDEEAASLGGDDIDLGVEDVEDEAEEAEKEREKAEKEAERERKEAEEEAEEDDIKIEDRVDKDEEDEEEMRKEDEDERKEEEEKKEKKRKDESAEGTKKTESKKIKESGKRKKKKIYLRKKLDESYGKYLPSQLHTISNRFYVKQIHSYEESVKFAPASWEFNLSEETFNRFMETRELYFIFNSRGDLLGALCYEKSTQEEKFYGPSGQIYYDIDILLKYEEPYKVNVPEFEEGSGIFEHHKKTKKGQIDFICKHDKDYSREELEKKSAKEVEKKYKALEKKMGLYENIKNVNELKPKPHIKKLGEFSNDEFKEFNRVVHKWSKENNEPVHWDLYVKDGARDARYYWDLYVKDGAKFNVFEVGNRLVGVIILKDGKIMPGTIRDNKGEVEDKNELFEHHKKTKKGQIDFICKHDKDCSREELEKKSAKEVEKKYKALEKKMGLVE